MADNITAPGAGTSLATKDIGGVHHPKTLMADGEGVEVVFYPRRAFMVTPHATNAITPLPVQVRINTAGTVTFRMADSTADVTMDAQAGEVIPGRVQYIRAAGTSATGFLALA